jgi:hypothetical protein
MTGDVAQAVEYLLCKCKALSSTLGSTKKKKKGIQQDMGESKPCTLLVGM